MHLGGDEVGSTCYNQSASVQAWLAKHPGVGVDDLIPMFSTRVHKIAAKHGKSVMNWEETFESIYLKPGEVHLRVCCMIQRCFKDADRDCHRPAHVLVISIRIPPCGGVGMQLPC